MSDDQGEHEIENLWINAFLAFPNLQPLVKLLRSDTPMTAGARDLLAELLCPGDPPIGDFVLELKPNAEFGKMLRKLNAVADYKRARAKRARAKRARAKRARATSAGALSEPPADEAGAKQNVTGRQVFRYLEEDIPQKLGERLRGKDPEPH
jgi:hypothetical protein